MTDNFTRQAAPVTSGALIEEEVGTNAPALAAPRSVKENYIMWSRDDGPPVNMTDPRAEKLALLAIAQEYVQACDAFERLQGEYQKLNEELKRVDNARRELREQLLHLINEGVESPALAKARSW